MHIAINLVITKWNLSRFAECLIPLINKDQNKAIEMATEIINTFEKKYEEKWLNMMRNKLGIFGTNEKDKSLILDLLTWMHENKVDYTNTFCHLIDNELIKEKNYENEDFLSWKKRWKKRILMNEGSFEKSLKLMKKTNPLVIPRNYKIEEALEIAENGDYSLVNKIIEALKEPYKISNEKFNYQNPGPKKENYKTFCGT